MPNDRRKPLTYKSNEEHEYESRASLSGCISLFYHNMLDKDWWTIVVTLSTVYITSILAFGIFYFVLEHAHFKIFTKTAKNGSKIYPNACLTGVTEPSKDITSSPEINFVKAFLLSLESQTTIG